MKKKILIIGFAKINYMPYLTFYLDNIKNNFDYDISIIYWDRNLGGDDPKIDGIQYYSFNYYLSDNVAIYKKIRAFLKYRKFAKKIIMKEKFDMYIFLHTFPAFLLQNKVSKKGGRYIFDYRDITYERYYFFKKIIENIVCKSRCTFISSEGFYKYLPISPKIIKVENLDWNYYSHREKIIREKNDKIRIAFWGFIRSEKINIKLIDAISTNEKIELHFYGREQETAIKLKQYCEKNRVSNVIFHGEYKPQERYEFIKNIDLVHNIYENYGNMKYAMANKYYDALLFYLPQLCIKDSLMGKKVENYKIGLAVDLNDSKISEKIVQYYQRLDLDEFRMNCDNVLKKIAIQYEKAEQNLISIMRKI